MYLPSRTIRQLHQGTLIIALLASMIAKTTTSKTGRSIHNHVMKIVQPAGT